MNYVNDQGHPASSYCLGGGRLSVWDHLLPPRASISVVFASIGKIPAKYSLNLPPAPPSLARGTNWNCCQGSNNALGFRIVTPLSSTSYFPQLNDDLHFKPTKPKMTKIWAVGCVSSILQAQKVRTRNHATWVQIFFTAPVLIHSEKS